MQPPLPKLPLFDQLIIPSSLEVVDLLEEGRPFHHGYRQWAAVVYTAVLDLSRPQTREQITMSKAAKLLYVKIFFAEVELRSLPLFYLGLKDFWRIIKTSAVGLWVSTKSAECRNAVNCLSQRVPLLRTHTRLGTQDF